MPMTIYIAGPISGHPDYLQAFSAAEKELKADGYIPMNPASLLPQSVFSYDSYIRMSMAMLRECDAIYLLPGWEKSQGACKEYRYALENQMVVVVGNQSNAPIKEVLHGQKAENAAL